MAKLPSVFNAADHDAGGFEPIPAGTYVAEIVKSEIKDTKDGTGKYISLQFKVIDGDYAKRLVFDMLNIVNKNQTAVEIANRNLKSIILACGHEDDYELEDTEDLHGIPMGIRVAIQEATAQWPAKNIIKGYMLESDIPETADDNPFA